MSAPPIPAGIRVREVANATVVSTTVFNNFRFIIFLPHCQDRKI